MNVKYLLPTVLVSLLVGCGTMSHVEKDGSTAEPVFPDLKKLTTTDGTWPNIENLRNIQAGATRDQIYDLIGHPHFKEGLGTREWDYLFQLRSDQGQQACQYKVLFDTDKRAQNFYWLPESCADLVNPKPVEVTTFSLDGDVTFGFDSAALTSNGKSEINKIAEQLRQQDTLETITVAGHTDRLGSVAYNNDLSQRRAETVREALISNGIDAQLINAVGYGESMPLVQCDNKGRTALISCLAPNRRVEITADGSSASK